MSLKGAALKVRKQILGFQIQCNFKCGPFQMCETLKSVLPLLLKHSEEQMCVVSG